MGGSRLVGHFAQEDARLRRPPPETAVAEALVCAKVFFSGGSARAKPRNCKIVAELSVSDRGYLVVQLACRLISLHKTPEKSPAFFFLISLGSITTSPEEARVEVALI